MLITCWKSRTDLDFGNGRVGTSKPGVGRGVFSGSFSYKMFLRLLTKGDREEGGGGRGVGLYPSCPNPLLVVSPLSYV